MEDHFKEAVPGPWDGEILDVVVSARPQAHHRLLLQSPRHKHGEDLYYTKL